MIFVINFITRAMLTLVLRVFTDLSPVLRKVGGRGKFSLGIETSYMKP